MKPPRNAVVVGICHDEREAALGFAVVEAPRALPEHEPKYPKDEEER